MHNFSRQENALNEFLKTSPAYFLMEPQTYSLQDLVQVKMGKMTEKLKQIVELALDHVDECVVSFLE